LEPLNVSNRQSPWSLLQTQWLDVPIGQDVNHANSTWGAFSEAFESCLLEVSSHVGQRSNDRAGLESVVTEVFVGNLDVLVSSLGNQEKVGRLLAAADRLMARRTSSGSTDAGSGTGAANSDGACEPAIC
jgi:hypothetical protein